MPEYNMNDEVQYKPVGGRESHTSISTGKIKNIITEPGTQAGRSVTASEDEPRYEIENSNTGKITSVYENNILGSV